MSKDQVPEHLQNELLPALPFDVIERLRKIEQRAKTLLREIDPLWPDLRELTTILRTWAAEIFNEEAQFFSPHAGFVPQWLKQVAEDAIARVLIHGPLDGAEMANVENELRRTMDQIINEVLRSRAASRDQTSCRSEKELLHEPLIGITESLTNVNSGLSDNPRDDDISRPDAELAVASEGNEKRARKESSSHRKPDLETSRKRVDMIAALSRELATLKQDLKVHCTVEGLKRRHPDYQLWKHLDNAQLRELVDGDAFSPKAYAESLTLRSFGIGSRETLKKDKKKLRAAGGDV